MSGRIKLKTLFIAAKDFLENFSLDYDSLTKQLEEIMKSDFSRLGIEKSMSISFDESKLFGKSGSVSKTNISFNKTRIEMLLNLKIDDTSKEHLKNVENFYNHYDEKKSHSDFEEILYEFIKKYKEIGAEWAFAHMGSYKTIKYEVLDTILHETEHVYQDEYSKFLEEKHFPEDKKSKVLIFTSLFNTIFEKLQKSGVQLSYERKNHVFPIEFDARYEALKLLSKIKNLYFKKDQDFSKHLIKSNIIPEDFSAEQTSAQIFADYESIYKLFTQNFGSEYEEANKYIQSNKNLIINEFIRRYNEMIDISQAEKANQKYTEQHL